jgi:hypothetical protein
MASKIALATSLGVAEGTMPKEASEKIGRTRSVQAGQMAGALEPRTADRIPATKVP